MSRTALVLRHDEKIHLGNLEPVLREHGYDIRYLETLVDDVSTVDPGEADLVVVLGLCVEGIYVNSVVGP